MGDETNHDDDDFDIYADLPNFVVENEVEKDVDVKKISTSDEQKVPKVKKEIKDLEKIVNELQVKLQELEGVNGKLKNNFSSLLKTAKAEISRKDRTISELRAKLDNITFRRNQQKQKEPPQSSQPPQPTQEAVAFGLSQFQTVANHQFSFPPPPLHTVYSNEQPQVINNYLYAYPPPPIYSETNEVYQETSDYGSHEVSPEINDTEEKTYIRLKKGPNTAIDDDDSDDGVTNKAEYRSTVYGERLRKKLQAEREAEERSKLEAKSAELEYKQDKLILDKQTIKKTEVQTKKLDHGKTELNSKEQEGICNKEKLENKSTTQKSLVSDETNIKVEQTNDELVSQVEVITCIKDSDNKVDNKENVSSINEIDTYTDHKYNLNPVNIENLKAKEVSKNITHSRSRDDWEKEKDTNPRIEKTATNVNSHKYDASQKTQVHHQSTNSDSEDYSRHKDHKYRNYQQSNDYQRNITSYKNEQGYRDSRYDEHITQSERHDKYDKHRSLRRDRERNMSSERWKKDYKEDRGRYVYNERYRKDDRVNREQMLRNERYKRSSKEDKEKYGNNDRDRKDFREGKERESSSERVKKDYKEDREKNMKNERSTKDYREDRDRGVNRERSKKDYKDEIEKNTTNEKCKKEHIDSKEKDITSEKCKIESKDEVVTNERHKLENREDQEKVITNEGHKMECREDQEKNINSKKYKKEQKVDGERNINDQLRKNVIDQNGGKTLEIEKCKNYKEENKERIDGSVNSKKGSKYDEINNTNNETCINDESDVRYPSIEGYKIPKKIKEKNVINGRCETDTNDKIRNVSNEICKKDLGKNQSDDKYHHAPKKIKLDKDDKNHRSKFEENKNKVKTPKRKITSTSEEKLSPEVKRRKANISQRDYVKLDIEKTKPTVGNKNLTKTSDEKKSTLPNEEKSQERRKEQNREESRGNDKKKIATTIKEEVSDKTSVNSNRNELDSIESTLQNMDLESEPAVHFLDDEIEEGEIVDSSPDFVLRYEGTDEEIETDTNKTESKSELENQTKNKSKSKSPENNYYNSLLHLAFTNDEEFSQKLSNTKQQVTVTEKLKHQEIPGTKISTNETLLKIDSKLKSKGNTTEQLKTDAVEKKCHKPSSMTKTMKEKNTEKSTVTKLKESISDSDKSNKYTINEVTVKKPKEHQEDEPAVHPRKGLRSRSKINNKIENSSEKSVTDTVSEVNAKSKEECIKLTENVPKEPKADKTKELHTKSDITTKNDATIEKKQEKSKIDKELHPKSHISNKKGTVVESKEQKIEIDEATKVFESTEKETSVDKEPKALEVDGATKLFTKSNISKSNAIDKKQEKSSGKTNSKKKVTSRSNEPSVDNKKNQHSEHIADSKDQKQNIERTSSEIQEDKKIQKCEAPSVPAFEPTSKPIMSENEVNRKNKSITEKDNVQKAQVIEDSRKTNFTETVQSAPEKESDKQESKRSDVNDKISIKQLITPKPAMNTSIKNHPNAVKVNISELKGIKTMVMARRVRKAVQLSDSPPVLTLKNPDLNKSN